MFHLVFLSQDVDVCTYGDDYYNLGESFISSNCTIRCTCMAGRQLACQNLCQIDDITCETDEVKELWSEQITDSQCSCPRMKCVKKPDGNYNFCLINILF